MPLAICANLSAETASLDTHGQLLRYIADLHYQRISADWLFDRRKRYLVNRGITGDMDQTIDAEKLKSYLADKGIEDKHLHLIRNSGIIIDEGFKPRLLKAVRHLNGQCGFSIRLLRMEAYVASDWDVNASQWEQVSRGSFRRGRMNCGLHRSAVPERPAVRRIRVDWAWRLQTAATFRGDR